MNRFRYFSVILYESHIQGMITKQRSLFQEEHTEVGSTSNIYLKAPRALVPTSLSPWDIITEKRNTGVTTSRNLCEPVRQGTSSLNYFHYPLFLKPVSLEYIYPKTTSMNLLIGPQLQDQLLEVTFLAPLLEPSSSRSPSSRWTFVAPYSSYTRDLLELTSLKLNHLMRPFSSYTSLYATIMTLLRLINLVNPINHSTTICLENSLQVLMCSNFKPGAPIPDPQHKMSFFGSYGLCPRPSVPELKLKEDPQKYPQFSNSSPVIGRIQILKKKKSRFIRQKSSYEKRKSGKNAQEPKKNASFYLNCGRLDKLPAIIIHEKKVGINHQQWQGLKCLATIYRHHC